MPRLTLKSKIGLYLTAALSAAMLVFVLVVSWHQRGLLLDKVSDQVTQLSEVIVKSTRFAMLQNQPAYVDRIIHDVASQGHIDRVRILSKDGRVIHSTVPQEIGDFLDRKAEQCVQCHRSETPLAQPPKGTRTWTFTNAEGRRVLGSMEVIRNEPACYNAACHQHSPSTSVLGVLDIVYSLDQIDRTVGTATATMAAFSLAFIVVASLSVGMFVHRLVYLPLRDLEGGARRVSSGDLEKPIPVRGGDEFGELAASFNAMTAALRNSRHELQEWGKVLEQKVKERTEELAKAQARTMRGEKLASVGLLASGIAHELNNPLTGILTFATLLRQNMPADSPDAADMDLVIRETKRCAAIIKRLLDFARDKKPEKNYSDINQIVEDTVRIVERPANLKEIDIVLDLDRSLPPIWIDADQIKQVVMNMLVNAQHAIEHRGSITIRTRRLPEPRSVEPDTAPVPMIEVSIGDTGCGIPERNLSRIFDPFFTSKEVGKGTGLGLSVSHGIVRAHGGVIEVESKVGEGSTFRVYLPLASADAGEPAGEGAET